MKRIWLLATVLCVWPGLGLAQTTEELVNDGKNPQHVTTQSMGYDRKNYSPLQEINKSSVRRLVPVWSTSLMNDLGELAAPTLYNGVLYAINSRWTFAIDVETGKQIWRTPVQIEPGAQGVAQYGAAPRGAATIYNGKLFRTTLDNHLLALDMKTGKELWNQRFADWHEGYSSSSAPIVANGVVISGMAGGESTTRGFLDGWDPETGKKLWRRYTIPEPGEPGSETWPRDSDAWKLGGGPTWRSGSYDPQLDLVYWGTGNAEPYDPRPRGGLDSLYTSSVIAIRPRTGEIACYFQYTPNDVYDVDGVDENVLADMPIGGQMRKVMIQANKNGFLYVLDRTNCKLITAHPYTRVNWASHIDLATGRPVLTDLYKRFFAGEEVEIYPQRGSNAVPIAFNPNTGLVYTSSWNQPRIQKLAPPKPLVLGKSYTLVEGRSPVFRPGDVLGNFVAINPLTGEKKWEIPLTDMPSSAGTLVTGGGLVFTGKATGEFIALDEETGKTLWQFKTSSSVNSTAITYMYKGRQYVTVASGLGGLLARRFAAEKVPSGGSMWTFALMPD
jgi:alcohol dehydrogenase (cytochrome c)